PVNANERESRPKTFNTEEQRKRRNGERNREPATRHGGLGLGNRLWTKAKNQNQNTRKTGGKDIQNPRHAGTGERERTRIKTKDLQHRGTEEAEEWGEPATRHGGPWAGNWL